MHPRTRMSFGARRLGHRPLVRLLASAGAPRVPVNGFTLVELVVVLGVLALLVSLLLPAMARSRAQGKSVRCLSNLRQIGMATLSYAQEFADRFPIAQYMDDRRREFVAWDTITPASDPKHARPGLIWTFADGGEVQQCPAYEGPSLTTGDPFTGYNYNTTYIGRGEGEGPYLNMDESPAQTAELRRPGESALVGDGGYRAGANKFMRAPMDAGVGEGTVHAGAMAFRHLKRTQVLYADHHGATVTKPCRKPGARPENEALLKWPENGFLSADDRAYSRY